VKISHFAVKLRHNSVAVASATSTSLVQRLRCRCFLRFQSHKRLTVIIGLQSSRRLRVEQPDASRVYMKLYRNLTSPHFDQDFTLNSNICPMSREILRLLLSADSS